MFPIKLTAAFANSKIKFLSWHGDNTFLDTAMAQLERQLKDVDCLPVKTPGFIAMDTNWGTLYKKLSLLFIANPHTQEIAPCCFFFPEIIVENPERKKILYNNIVAVLDELEWK